MAKILQPCTIKINELDPNSTSPTLNTITIPLDNDNDSSRSFENPNIPTLTQPDKKHGTHTTSLPYILKSEDESCLKLDDSRLLPMHTNTPPPVPAKMVSSTANDFSQRTTKFVSHKVSSPPHQFLTPPSSPLVTNHILNEENDKYDDDDDDDDGDGDDDDDDEDDIENMILSPPPSAKSLTMEFGSFASGAIPGILHGIQNSTVKEHTFGLGLVGPSNNNSNIERLSIQEQKLPVLPQYQQQPLPDKENSIQDMHTGRSKSLPSWETQTSKHSRIPLASPQSLSSKPTSSSFIAIGSDESRQWNTPVKTPTTSANGSERIGFVMGKQQTSPPNDSMIHQSPMIPDGTYYPDSSLYAASITKPAPHPLSLTPHHPRFPPATLENLNNFRHEAQASPHDPALQLNFAKYLMEAVDQAQIEDATREIKAKTAMLSEAQRIIKTLAMQPKRGKSGYADAQFYLANAYGAGLMLLQVNHEKAFHLYLQGSKQAHPGCTYRAGVCYELGLGTRRDNARAIRFYRKAANLGDPPAMYKLAIILLRGLLGQGNHPKEAISWLKKAAPLANAYHPEILHELGLAYEHEGIPSVIPDQDYTRELLTKAARFGYAPSQFKLGVVYENGLWGCPMDARRSIAWYAKAAEQGHLESALALSGWYLTGAKSPDGKINILPQNDLEAYLWAKKVAEVGYAKGQYAVGYYYETGIGVEQNLIEAMKWYEMAAKQHYTKAIARLDELKQNTNITHRQRIKHRMRLSLQTSPLYLAKTDNGGQQQQRRHSINKTSYFETKNQHYHSQYALETTTTTTTTTPRSSMGKGSDCRIM